MITGWGSHMNDIAQWGNGTDDTGPVEIEGTGVYPPAESFWNVLLKFESDIEAASPRVVELVQQAKRDAG